MTDWIETDDPELLDAAVQAGVRPDRSQAMSKGEWRESTDPEELAAAVKMLGRDAIASRFKSNERWRAGTSCGTPGGFAWFMAEGLHYAVPASFQWPPTPEPADDATTVGPKVRLTVRLDCLTQVHEIHEGGFWRYVTDDRDRPERLVVRCGPAPCDRYEYPLAKIVSIHMDPIGAKR